MADRAAPDVDSMTARSCARMAAAQEPAFVAVAPITRRSLPLNALRAFESVAKHRSFAAAGKALWISPSALSRHVSSLERFCGSPLFDGRVTPLALTPTGLQLLSTLRKSFAKIEETLQDIRTRDGVHKRALRARMPPGVAAQLALPALRDFVRCSGERDIELTTSTGAMSTPADFDLAVVRLGADTVAPMAERLWEPRFSILCHPNLVDAGTHLDLAQFIDANAIAHIRPEGMPRHHVWTEFLRQAGIHHVDVRRGPVFDCDILAKQYVLSGQGIALLDTHLFADEISAARLVKPFETELTDGSAYFLISHADDCDDPVVARFRSWILSRLGCAGAGGSWPS
ncbi:MAG: LysR family transcriptional regulator, glycine cleavage system transcriptional activator [Gammaproteobacteria bacterium]|jgi:DNA-binding transcriptional LysR family regulator|nr:LysR family transcriptional regulator, glycine cleavage system transcriptional activator [Gammaproteobacteria bacterium]